MLIADGNLTFAVINAMTGQWIELKTQAIYSFQGKENNPMQLTVSINGARPADCRISFNDEICYIEFNKVRYRLWYMDNTKDVKMELHSEESKMKFSRHHSIKKV